MKAGVGVRGGVTGEAEVAVVATPAAEAADCDGNCDCDAGSAGGLVSPGAADLFGSS